MKITQKKQKKREYIIEMTGKEFDMFIDDLKLAKLKILNEALRRTMVEAMRGMGKIQKVKKELAEFKKSGLGLKTKEKI